MTKYLCATRENDAFAVAHSSNEDMNDTVVARPGHRDSDDAR